MGLFCNSPDLPLLFPQVYLLLSLAWGGTGGEAKNVVLKDFILTKVEPGFIGQTVQFNVLHKHISFTRIEL